MLNLLAGSIETHVVRSSLHLLGCGLEGRLRPAHYDYLLAFGEQPFGHGAAETATAASHDGAFEVERFEGHGGGR